ncbi:MAG: hypothetical protein JXA30_01375 [Deltaproteobacteria bacterium]|nr:hypothetical protein [Deltaproteobacteria bacterium]
MRRVRQPEYYFKNTPEEIEYRIIASLQLVNGDIEALIGDVETAIRERQSQAAYTSFKPTRRSRWLPWLRLSSIDMFAGRCPPISTPGTPIRFVEY